MWEPDDEDDYTSSALEAAEQELDNLQIAEEEIESNRPSEYFLKTLRLRAADKSALPSCKESTESDTLEQLGTAMKEMGIYYREESNPHSRLVVKDDIDDEIIMSGPTPIFLANRFFEPSPVYSNQIKKSREINEPNIQKRDSLPELITVPKPVPPPPGLDRTVPPNSTGSKKGNKGKGKKGKFKPAPELWSESEPTNFGPPSTSACSFRESLAYRKFNN